MTSLPRTRALFLVLMVAMSLVLVACGNKEAGQRKAFIEFLQTRVLEQPGVRVPALTDALKASIGDYAQHYAVIVDFNEGMNRSVSQPLNEIVAKGALRSVADLVARRDDIKVGKDGMVALRGAVDAQLARAEAARALLKQPDDLKPVYDKAFDKTVAVPAATFKEVFPALDAVLDGAIAMADYIQLNKAKIKIDGSAMTVSDPAVQAQLNKMLQDLNGRTAAVNAAQRKLQAMVRGA